MNDNEVSLNINGDIFKYWKSVSITSELNTVAPAFSVNALSKSSLMIDRLKSGRPVTVKIGEDTVLTGYIEQTPVSYSATSANVGIAGRSKTCDLIDCTVMVDDPNVFYEKPDTSNSNYVSCPQNAATEYKNVALETIIAQLIMPYGIKLVNETKPLTKKRNFSAKHEDTVLKALQNLTSTENLLFYGNEKGDLVVTEKGKLTADDALVLGQNILTGDASFDASKIYKYYRAVGQDKGVTGKTGHAASCHNYTAVDDNVSRTRLLTKKVQGAADTAKCKVTAEGDRDYNRDQYFKITYKVQGWRQSTGKLWKINSLVDIKDDFLGIDTQRSQKFLITRVVFNLTENEGMTTTLDVIPPNGWRLETENDKEDPKKVIIKKSSNSSADFSWINKKQNFMSA